MLTSKGIIDALKLTPHPEEVISKKFTVVKGLLKRNL